MPGGNEFLTDFSPFTVKGIGASRFLLIRAHAVQAAHDDIAQQRCISCPHQKFGIHMESRIALDARQI